MSDEQQTAQAPKKSSMKMNLVILLAVLLVAGIGLFASMKTGLDKAVVESKLQEWIAYQEAKNPKTKISYGVLEMAGEGLDRHAVLRDVLVVMREEVEDEEPLLKAQTPLLLLKPKDISFSEFSTEVPESITFTEEGEVTTISYDKPLVTQYQIQRSDERAVTL